ncbi:MAG: DUF3724 domain-containing protein [Bacteroidetes bacterium]|nr:DUF3724 domain-containing protein [Bacteroidota bacterium]
MIQAQAVVVKHYPRYTQAILLLAHLLFPLV